MKRTVFLTLAACLYLGASNASAQDLQAQLNANYTGKILVLRHPSLIDSQKFDAVGNLKTSGNEGAWSIYGIMEINSIELTSSKIRVHGTRVVHIYEAGELRPFSTKAGPKLSLELALPGPINNSEQADAVLHKVFAVSSADKLATVSEYLRWYLAAESAHGGPGTNWDSANPAASSVETTSDQTQTFFIAKGPEAWKDITRPQPIYTPPPASRWFDGNPAGSGVVALEVIVDHAGRLQLPKIIQSIRGVDLDALMTIGMWRFKPATKAGKPITSQMVVEVAYSQIAAH